MALRLLPFMVKHVNECKEVLDRRVSHIQSSGNAQPAKKNSHLLSRGRQKYQLGYTQTILKFRVTFEQVISTVALSSLGIFHHVVGKFIHMP